MHIWLLAQNLAGLNGAKIINLGGLKGNSNNMGSSMGSLDDLAAQLGAIERQLGGEPKKPRVRMLKDGKYQVLFLLWIVYDDGDNKQHDLLCSQILSSDDDDDDEEDIEAGVQRDKALTRKTVRAIQQLFNDGR